MVGKKIDAASAKLMIDTIVGLAVDVMALSAPQASRQWCYTLEKYDLLSDDTHSTLVRLTVQLHGELEVALAVN